MSSQSGTVPPELSIEEIKKWSFGKHVEAIESIDLLGQQGALSRSFKLVIKKSADAPASLPSTFCVKLHTENPVPHKQYKYLTEVKVYSELFTREEYKGVQTLVPSVYHYDLCPLGKQDGMVLVLDFLSGGKFFSNAEAIKDVALAKHILQEFKKLQLQFKMPNEDFSAFSAKNPFVWSGMDVTFATFFPGSTVTSFDERAKMIAEKLAPGIDMLLENSQGYPQLKENLQALKSADEKKSFKDYILESLDALKNDKNGGLVHGDFKLDNIFMFDANNADSFGDIKVIDWQGPTLGKPMADAVYFAMQSIDASIQDQVPSMILDVYSDFFDGRENCNTLLKASLWMHLCLYSLFAQSPMYASEEGTNAMRAQLGSYVECFIRGAQNTTANLVKYYKK